MIADSAGADPSTGFRVKVWSPGVRLLHWLLNRCYDVTIAVLTGLMVGSLRKIWLKYFCCT